MPHDESEPPPTVCPDQPPPTEPPPTVRGDSTNPITVPVLRVGGPAAPAGFVLGDEIGRGGMGVVYAAVDTEVGREVAVKLLRPEFLASPSAAARFVEESRITGQLQHPGIPAVYRVGTTAESGPFLAMKLVRGHTLAELLKDAPDRGRLIAVFEGVCQAVGYAHAHGVIHRDLKPQNVMVGAFGEVQVMDWGLAKVLASPAGEGRVAEPPTRVRDGRPAGDETSAGSVLGTPAYMPPEQATGAVDRIDRRSDMFGLGGILCAILTGRPPYVGDSAESTRQLAARADLGDAFARLDGCGADPGLVALCKRCLSADPAGRPADGAAAGRVVADLRAAADERARQAELDRVRAAADQRAAEQSAAAEQRRRRQLARAAVLVTAVFAAGAGVSVWQAVRATHAEELTASQLALTTAAERVARTERDNARAAEEWAKAEERKEKKAREVAEAVSAFMQEVFAQSSARVQIATGRPANRNLTVREAMDYAVGNIADRFRDRPDIEAEVRTTIGIAYGSLGEPTKSLAQHERALALRDEALGPDHPDTLQSVDSLATRLHARGDLAASERLHRRAVAGYERLCGPDHPTTLRSVSNLGRLLQKKGEAAAAVPLLRRVLAGHETAYGPDHPDTLKSALNLAELLRAAGEPAAAEALCRRAAAGFEKACGPDHPDTLQSVHNLGALLRERGDAGAAEPLLRRALAGREAALGPDHPDTLTTVSQLALLLQDERAFAAAEALLRRAAAGYEKAGGPDHPDTLEGLHRLAALLRERGDPTEAEPLFRRVLGAREKALGPDHPDTLNTVNSLAVLLDSKRQPAAAETLYRRALAGREKALPPDHPDTLASVYNLGEFLWAKGDLAAAEPLQRRAWAGYEKTYGPTHPYTLRSVGRLAVFYTAQDRHADAIPVLERAVAGYAVRPEMAGSVPLVRGVLGVSLLAVGRTADAEPHLIAGYDVLSRQKALSPVNRDRLRKIGHSLIALYTATGRPEQAAAVRAALPPEIAPPPRPRK